MPFSLTVGRLAVADSQGAWLIAKDVHFAWSPAALLLGRVRIDDLTADIIRVRRAPVVHTDPNRPVSFEWPPRFASPTPMRVEKLGVNRLILDAALVGQDATFGLDGHLSESGQGLITLHLAAARQDGAPLTLATDAAFDYRAWKLTIDSHLTDAPNGLVTSALTGNAACSCFSR